MKITKERLVQIVREELQREFAEPAFVYDPREQELQGVDPTVPEVSDAVFKLRQARPIIARALPRLLKHLDTIIVDMAAYPGYPTEEPEGSADYLTIYEDGDE